MTQNDQRRALAKEVAAKTVKNFGMRSATTAAALADTTIDVTSTGVMAFDYMTGIGGIPTGFPTEFFGIPDIGKSTIFGLGTIREAQKAGRLCGLIAMEPSFDEKWAIKHGVDPELLIVAYPKSGQEAFAILYEWVEAGVPDFIVFDSIGAVATGGTSAAEGKPKAYGGSGIISAGLTNVAPMLFRNNVSLVLLNQVRDDTSSRIAGLLDSPGGWALRHLCPLRVQLKPGAPFKAKVKGIEGSDEVTIGRTIIGIIKRNKLAEESAPGWKAQFDFYHKTAEGYPFGLDLAKDVKNTGILSGVIESKGAWLYHSTFPKGKINGKEKLDDFIQKSPIAVDKIREDVMDAMLGGANLQKPTLEAVQND